MVWIIFIFIIIIVLIFVWWLYGGNKHEFVGLKNMEPPSKSSTSSQSSTQICIVDDDEAPAMSRSKSKVKIESKSRSKRVPTEIVVHDEVIEEIITELEQTRTTERAGRAQDHHERNAMQKLRAKGFM